MSENILITACSLSPGTSRWLASLSAMRPRNLQPLIVMFEPYFDVPDWIVVEKTGARYPSNVRRFLPLADIIRRYGEDRWYLWTDCADLVFQRDIDEHWFENSNVDGYFSTEGVVHDKSFWDRYLTAAELSVLRNEIIHNAGCFLVKGHFFVSIIEFMHGILSELGTFPSVFDQLLLNKWIVMHKDRCASFDRACLNLYNRYRPGDSSSEAHCDGSLFRSAGGEIYSIVHANGGTKEVLDRIDLTTCGQ
jgi:hypothetical protein